MSKADKMFEDLGYENVDKEHPYFIEYEFNEVFKGGDTRSVRIVINTITREVYIHELFNEKYSRSEVSIKLHLAIHEKLKELGWLDVKN